MSLDRRQLILGACALVRPELSPPETLLPRTEHRFKAAGYLWQMTLEYYDWPAVNRLSFLNQITGRSFCASTENRPASDCTNSFVGSVGIARYRIMQQGATRLPRLRERVRTIDRCDWLTERPPFERVIEWQNGLASDIQAFGFFENGTGTTDNAWCIFRQELYLENTVSKTNQREAIPALILHWKHTLKQVRMLDVIVGGEGTPRP
jgi:hypothetical protein